MTANRPGATAQSRRRRRRRATLARWWRAVRLAYAHFEADEGWTLAGYIAFASLLALFPFMIFAMSLASATVGPTELQALIDMLFELAPANVAGALAPVLRDVLGQDRGGLLTISAAGALWASSNGVEAFRVAFDRAYGAVETRSFLMRRLTGLGFVLLGAVTFALLGFLVVLAPLALRLVQTQLGIDAPVGLTAVRYGIALSAFALFLWLLHLILPSRPTWRIRLWPGILATIGLWLAAALAFSTYLSYAPSYSVTYGGLAGVIVSLLFFYLSGAVIIFGAELNAALNKLRVLEGDGPENAQGDVEWR